MLRVGRVDARLGLLLRSWQCIVVVLEGREETSFVVFVIVVCDGFRTGKRPLDAPVFGPLGKRG